MIYKTNQYYSEFISNREAILANLSEGGLFLRFLWKNPDVDIIASFAREPFFQLYFKGEIMFLLLKFINLKWIDIPCVFAPNSKNLFSCDFEKLPCYILLANSNTGRVVSNNLYYMPIGITKAFVQGIHIQKDLTKKSAVEKINTIRSSYSACEMSRLSLGSAK